jgi:small subunit ribosomal protein S8
MLILDPIADFLTRIRNAQMAGHTIVEIPSSKMKRAITKIMYDNGFIAKYKFDADAGQFEKIKIALKYDPATRQPVIRELGRISRPGLRKYVKVDDLPRILNGLGIAVVSTSKGVMTDKQAREHKVGGELLCYIY